MADTPDIPEPLAALESNARFASKFSRTTNLAQRARYRQDQADYAAALVAQREADQASRLATDRNAQALYFRTKELDLKERAARFKMEQDDALLPSRLALQEQQLRTSAAMEKARLSAERMQAQKADRLARDTEGFATEVASVFDSDLDDDTRQNAILGLRSKYPFADTALFDDVWKSTGSRLDPQEAIDAYKQVQVALPGTRPRVSPGGVSIETPPERPAFTPGAKFNARLRLEESRRRAAERPDDPAEQAAFQDLQNEFDATFNVQKAAPSTPAKEPTVASAAEFAALPSGTVFVDPKGVRRRKP